MLWTLLDFSSSSGREKHCLYTQIIAKYLSSNTRWVLLLRTNMEDEDQDVYVEQLWEVFDSCDVEGKGFLKKQGLIELCQKLQLEDQVPKLLAQLLGNQDDGEVSRWNVFILIE